MKQILTETQYNNYLKLCPKEKAKIKKSFGHLSYTQMQQIIFDVKHTLK